MAFQRPFLISLKRSDSQQRWGFGITGGKEYGQPLQIQTVAEDSIAERCGLHEGDEVIQVGRVNVQDLSQGHAYELLARCGNKIEMFVIREDLFSQKKGKEPPTIKAVVHNPYNSPLQLYSTENIAETLAKQTEVLTEGYISPEDEEGPENLSFKQKSAVFQLLEEQAKQETGQKPFTRGSPQRQTVIKPKAAPPPPPKPKPPAQEPLYNGYDSPQRQTYQDQQRNTRVEYQTTQKVVNQYQYQQEQPIQYKQTNIYQTNSYQKSPGYQSPVTEKNYSPGYQSPVANYQQRNYQQTYQQSNYQQQQSPHSPAVNSYQQYPGYQSPVTTTYQPLNQVNYQQTQQNRGYQTTQSSHPREYQIQVQTTTTQQAHKEQKSPTAVSKAEFKIGPPPPPRGSSTKHQETDSMAAIYKQQYEQHLQQQFDQQQMYMNNIQDVGSPPKAHIIKESIFEHNSTSGTPITYKAPPAAPPKPNWPPPPQPEQFHSPAPPSPTNMRVGSIWPPKKSTVTELPKSGFNTVREQGNGRKCVWPPPKTEDEYRSGRSTPQSPVAGRRIQWNPSPSPPSSRRAVFGASQSPVRRKDIQWPPASPTAMVNEKEIIIRGSPRLTRKGRFEDYIREHASINVPQTYRPPPGTQHVEYR